MSAKALWQEMLKLAVQDARRKTRTSGRYTARKWLSGGYNIPPETINSPQSVCEICGVDYPKLLESLGLNDVSETD